MENHKDVSDDTQCLRRDTELEMPNTRIYLHA